jgi:hypothetical protein
MTRQTGTGACGEEEKCIPEGKKLIGRCSHRCEEYIKWTLKK